MKREKSVYYRCPDCGGSGNKGKCQACKGTGTIEAVIVVDDGQPEGESAK